MLRSRCVLCFPKHPWLLRDTRQNRLRQSRLFCFPFFVFCFFTSVPPAEVAEVVKVAARTMSSSPGTGGSNPRKFSEKIALHNQKQAEETRAFEQLMTDLTVSRVNSLSAPCAASVPLLLLLLCVSGFSVRHSGSVRLLLRDSAAVKLTFVVQDKFVVAPFQRRWLLLRGCLEK